MADCARRYQRRKADRQSAPITVLVTSLEGFELRGSPWV